MNLSEIAISFKRCTGYAPSSFKDYLISLDLSPEEVSNGVVITNANNHIFRDIELLLNKALINLCASDLLLKQGYFNWAFVTSYYSSFYSIQALNRLQLNFNTWTHSGLECSWQNFFLQELKVKEANNSSGSHESQFNKFYVNYNDFRYRKSIDRFWTLGIRNFKIRPETTVRNDINYSIEDFYYYELDLDSAIFDKIIADNKIDPAGRTLVVSKPLNYALPNTELALARIRIILYILNYIANSNIEYKTYFGTRCSKRLKAIHKKYPALSGWILSRLTEWLQFIEVETDDVLTT